MFIGPRPQTKIRVAADVLEAKGFHAKASGLRGFAGEMDLWEPVIRGFGECRDGDFAFNREGLRKAIEKWEDDS